MMATRTSAVTYTPKFKKENWRKVRCKRIKLRYEMLATQAMVQNCPSPGVIFPKQQALPPL